MFGVSARFLAGLRVARWVPEVSWSLDGATWLPCTLHAGTVQASATQQARWSLSGLRVSGVEVDRRGFSPYGTRLRVRLGMAHSATDVEYVPLGVYRLEDVDRGLTGRTVETSAKSFEQQVIDARFVTPRVIPPTSARLLTQALVREAVPGALVRWSVDDTILPRIVAERERWEVLDGPSDATSVARSLGARIYCDGQGIFTAAPVPTLADAPVWTADTGEGGLLLDGNESLSRDGVYNAVVVTGESTDPDVPPVGPGIAVDDDPASPTYWGGPFGMVPRFYSSPLLRTQVACEKAALGMLQPYLGLRQTARLQLVNPALTPDDVIDVRMPDGSLQASVVESVSIDLANPSAGMEVSLRSAATRLAGGLYTPPEQEYGE